MQQLLQLLQVLNCMFYVCDCNRSCSLSVPARLSIRAQLRQVKNLSTFTRTGDSYLIGCKPSDSLMATMKTDAQTFSNEYDLRALQGRCQIKDIKNTTIPKHILTRAINSLINLLQARASRDILALCKKYTKKIGHFQVSGSRCCVVCRSDP